MKTLRKIAIATLIIGILTGMSLASALAATPQTNKLVWNKMDTTNQSTGQTNQPNATPDSKQTANAEKTPASDKTLAETNLNQNTRSIPDAIPKQADYVYSYMPNEVYKVYCMVDRIVDIQLQPGEEIVYIGGSDTVRWIIDKDISGNGTNKQYHLFIKPQKDNLSAGLIITTDRHVYHLELYSRDFCTPIINWNYPSEDKMAFQRQQEKEQKLQEDTLTISGSMTLENLNFKYSISGGTVFWRTVSWKPQLAFDDGEKTYIQMPITMKSSEAPALFVKEGNELALVNYRVKMYENNIYYVVDRLADSFEMRVGKDVVKVKKQVLNGQNW